METLLNKFEQIKSFNEIGKISYENSKSKGLWDERKSYNLLYLLMQAEVSEVVEDYRRAHGFNDIWFEENGGEGHVLTQNQYNTNKPCGIPTELADIVLWICECFAYYKQDLDSLYSCIKNVPFVGKIKSFGFSELLSLTSEYLAKSSGAALECERYFHLAIALHCVMIIADDYDIDLTSAIKLKLAYNKTRSHKHGGKLF